MRREKGAENIFKDRIGEKHPKIRKQCAGTRSVECPKQDKSKEIHSTSRDIIIKMSKSKDKRKISKKKIICI